MSWADEYLKVVAEQIRVKRIRTALTDELQDHMELQKADFLDEGLSEAEAEQKTIEEMGDALLVGGELDRVHRPKPQWKGMLLALLLMLIGMLLRTVFTPDGQAQPIDFKQCAGVCIAMGAVLLLGLTDYVRWVKWAVPLAAIWSVLVILKVLDGPNRISRYWGFGASIPELWRLTIEHVALAAPLLTAMMTARMRGGKWAAFAVCLMIPALTFLLGLSYTWIGRTPDTVMLLALLAMGTAALGVKRGFFHVNRKRAYFILAGCAAAILAVFIVNPNRGQLYPGREYMEKYVWPLLSSAKLWGAGRMDNVLLVKMNELYSAEQLLPYIIYRYGWIPFGIGAAAVAAAMIGSGRKLMRTENSMGSLMGIASMATIAFQLTLCCLLMVIYINVPLGLPLVSYGTVVLWLDAAMIGMILSVLRGENLPERTVEEKKKFGRGIAA